jgi:nickel-dependent lactate racemase
MPWFSEESPSLSRQRVLELVDRLLDEARSRITRDFRRVLLLPPDLTRMHSGAGWITEALYHRLPKNCDVHVIPTLGQHVPHTEEENRVMFGRIPNARIHPHDYKHGVQRVGVVPASVMEEKSNGQVRLEIPVDLNKMLVGEKWDLIVNVGHVVPHEVLGFANHNKNYFIGLGGKETLCASHIAAAFFGIENNLGRLITPLRACYNWAQEQFLSHLPDVFAQIVMARDEQQNYVQTGLHVGDDLETYLAAARQSRRQNVTLLDEPVKKIVAVMQADEFRSTWVANKAVYRTRLAMADGGELLILAPGLERFGEQPEIEAIIAKYGYCGTPKVMELYKTQPDLQDYANGAAHLMNGSPEGRFKVTYAPGKLSREKMESVHFGYADLQESLKRYPPETLKEGWNTMPDGERIYFINTPSAGLWSTRERMADRDMAVV